MHYKKVEKQYLCSQCSHVVYSKQALMYHTERQHNEENKVAKVECNYCDKKFHVKHSLDVHVRYAHKSYQVKCEYCSEAFKKQSNLNSHMKYVHDLFCNKILLDDECEITFFELDTKKGKHFLVHNVNLKLNGWPIFNFNFNLTRHSNEIHGINLETNEKHSAAAA